MSSSIPSPPLIERRKSSDKSRSSLDFSGIKSALKHDHLHECEDDNKVIPENSAVAFERRVGFDTFLSGLSLEGVPTTTGGGTGVSFSFTLSAKSVGYARSKASRTFLVATDLNEYSRNAVDFLLEDLIEDSDEVVVLRVIEAGSSAHDRFVKSNMEDAREEADKLLKEVMKKNGDERKISLIVEFAIGQIEETIHRMIEIYRPDSLIVGTRGRPDSMWKTAFMGSISRWAVAKSPIPIIVVRPEKKLKRSLARAEHADPKKRPYVSLLAPHINPSPETIPAYVPASQAPRAGRVVEGASLLTRVTEGHARKSGDYEEDRGRIGHRTTV